MGKEAGPLKYDIKTAEKIGSDEPVLGGETLKRRKKSDKVDILVLANLVGVLTLKVMTPQGGIFTEVVDSVSLPLRSEGRIEILENHCSLVALLEPGVLNFSVNGVSERWGLLRGGFVNVLENDVLVVSAGGVVVEKEALDK